MKIPHSKVSIKQLTKLQQAYLDGEELEIHVVVPDENWSAAGKQWEAVRQALNQRLAELQLPKVGNDKGDTYFGGFSRKKKTVACSIRQKPSKYGPHMTDEPLITVRDIGWDGNLIFFIGPDMVSKRERSYGATKEALTEFIAYRANEIKNVSDYLASGMNNRSDEWPDWQRGLEVLKKP